MKKKLLLGFILICLVAFFLLVGCDTQKPLTADSIAIKEGTHFSTSIGKFDCSAYTLVLTKDGVESYVPLSLDMISAADAMNFYKAGSYTITVHAYGQTCEFCLDVAENEFSGYSFDDIRMEYTGETVFAEVKGDLPEGTVILYPDGNSFSEVGRYNVSAVLTCNNYKTEVLNATVEITPAKYDISGIRFDDVSYVYDGTPKSISVTGEIPEGVTVAYRIGAQYTASCTNANDAGYEVTASFISANVNYEPIPDMTARLIIRKADYDLSGIVIDPQSFRYSGQAHNVWFTAEDQLPKGVVFRDVTATYVDANGETQTLPSDSVLVGSSVKKAVSLKDAHVYTVSYSFSVSDAVNYNVPEPIESQFEITKIAYELSGVTFSGETFNYDNTPKFLSVLGNVSDDLTVEYVGNGKTDVGEYEVTANFIVADPVNYSAPANMTATLRILKASYSLSSGDFIYQTDIPYTGEAILPTISVELPEGLIYETTVYLTDEPGAIGNDMQEVAEAKELGSYVLRLRVAGEKINNYHPISDVYLPFNVVKCTYDTGEMDFVTEFEFDGKPHYPEVVNLPEGLRVVYDRYVINVSDGEVEVLATFEPINDFYASYYITPTAIRTSVRIVPTEYQKPYGFLFDDQSFVYNSTEHSIEGQITGEYAPGVPLADVIEITYSLEKVGLGKVSGGNRAKEIGEYVVTATLSIVGNGTTVGRDENYYFPEFSARIIITRGAVKASDVEKAMYVKTTPTGKTLIFDPDLLGENYFVYDDFLGYYEKDSDGKEGILFTDPVEWNFCIHEVYLKFEASALYTFVDDGGNVISDYAPHMTVEMESVFRFSNEYSATVTANSMSIITARRDGGRFAEIRTLKKAAEMMTSIKSCKLIYQDGDPIEYDVETETENGVIYLLMPPVELIGKFELRIEVGFLNVKYTNTVEVVYDYELSDVTITRATDEEVKSALTAALNGQPLFMVNDGWNSRSYYWGELNIDLILPVDGAVTVSVDESRFGSTNAPYANDETDGIFFDIYEIIYLYRPTINDSWTTRRHVGNGAQLMDEGYYVVYFVPKIYDKLSGTDTVFTVDDAKLSGLPSISFLLHYETHEFTESDANDLWVFRYNSKWTGHRKYGEMNEDEQYRYEGDIDSNLTYFIKTKLLDDGTGGLPFFVTLSLENVSRGPKDLYDYRDRLITFTLVINVDGSPKFSKTLKILGPDTIW